MSSRKLALELNNYIPVNYSSVRIILELMLYHYKYFWEHIDQFEQTSRYFSSYITTLIGHRMNMNKKKFIATSFVKSQNETISLLERRLRGITLGDSNIRLIGQRLFKKGRQRGLDEESLNIMRVRLSNDYVKELSLYGILLNPLFYAAKQCYLYESEYGSVKVVENNKYFKIKSKSTDFEMNIYIIEDKIIYIWTNRPTTMSTLFFGHESYVTKPDISYDSDRRTKSTSKSLYGDYYYQFLDLRAQDIENEERRLKYLDIYNNLKDNGLRVIYKKDRSFDKFDNGLPQFVIAAENIKEKNPMGTKWSSLYQHDLILGSDIRHDALGGFLLPLRLFLYLGMDRMQGFTHIPLVTNQMYEDIELDVLINKREIEIQQEYERQQFLMQDPYLQDEQQYQEYESDMLDIYIYSKGNN